MTQQRFVIVGAGLAGAKAAEALRGQGFDGRITLIGAEPHRPYERPPLSKGYLMGTSDRAGVFVHEESWYADHDVELRLGVAAAGLDRGAHRVELADGATIGYDKLLLATGALPRRPPIPGADAPHVRYLRRIEDCESLKDVLATVSRLAVIGAGWIGLEVTAAARRAGVEVTVLEAAPLPLLRVLGPEVARVFADLHRDHGADLRLGVTVSEITPSGVRLGDGTEIAADAVLVGVGVEPDVRLALHAGLRVDDGIVVDAALRTDDPDIVAAGDVANAYHPLLGRHIRVEHWANALKQPAVAAATMLGRDAVYEDLPYFYTDQYDLGMEYVGHVEPGGYDQVVFRGDVAAREFIAFWLSGDRVLAGMNVNVWDVVEPIKQLIRTRTPVTPQALADPDQPLETRTTP
ncbi:pyridine nucleotide-disulfide oxidoreductase [Microbispora rosea subsp. aerata]|nr:FAD-dependent oxidoreductase [Microbispora rosea]GGO08309.1 pyridine nucleotide-disulfide oxidoreductase [Microbispora rosea subsp. aerata]GIH55434.1 pyridine nucleotide-disulfide oxidoreductase [Microbispora rosea subsp. aerata]GLJ84631.1 pyridine nucleotide-disulfide oxidoreductase [Microbispora rosea subsp. aerata]